MTKFLVVLLAVLGVACSAAPPETFAIQPTVRGMRHAIEPAFTDAQVEVIREAVRAWCESDRGFCPTEVAWDENPDARVYLNLDYAKADRPKGSMAWTNAARTEVQVNPAATEDLYVFWRVIAHEFGHLSGLEHGEGGLELMATHPDPYGPLAIE
jgi:hypothetical protein